MPQFGPGRGKVSLNNICCYWTVSAEVKLLGSTSDRYSTRSVQYARSSGPDLRSFEAAPLERNTRGFQPRSQTKADDQTSSSPAPSTVTLPQAKVDAPAGTANLSGTTKADTPNVAQGQDAISANTLQNGNDETKAINTETTAANAISKNLKPHQRPKKAIVEQPSNHADSLAEPSWEIPTAHEKPVSFAEAANKRAAKAETRGDTSTFTTTNALTTSGAKVSDKINDIEQNTQGTPVGARNTERVKSQGHTKEINRENTISKSFTMSITPAPHISLNRLPKYAWNGGVNPKGPKSSRVTHQTISTQTPDHSGTALPVGEVTSPEKVSLGEKDEGGVKVTESPDVIEQHTTFVDTSKIESVSSIKEEAGPNTRNGVGQMYSQDQDLHMTTKATTDIYVPPHLRAPKPKPIEACASVKTAEVTVTPAPKTHEALSNDPVRAVNDSETVGEDHSYLPPHLRPAKTKKPVSDVEPEVVQPLHSAPKVSNGHDEEVNPIDNVSAPIVPSSAKGKEKATSKADKIKHNASNDTSPYFPDAKQKPRKYTKLERLMIKKGYDVPDPDAPLPPVIGNWDDRKLPWEERAPHNYGTPEHITKTQEWTGKTAIEQPMVVDTSAAEFGQGAYIPVGEHHDAVIDDEAHTTHLPDDPYTKAKSGETSNDRIEAFRKKKAEEDPPREKLTKAQKKEMRENWLANQRRYIEMENDHPNKPAVDMYIRPAEQKDLMGITEIYNWYITSTAVAPQLVKMTVAEWRGRIEDCRAEGFECYVAVQRSGRDGVQQHRAAVEPICGFVYAGDMYDRKSIFRFTARMEVYVSKEFPHVGVGRCLIDRIMSLLDMNSYHKRGGCEWRGQELMTRREVKKIFVEIPYWDQDIEDVASMKWKWQWLTGEDDKSFMRFEYTGTLHHIGWKQHKT